MDDIRVIVVMISFIIYMIVNTAYIVRLNKDLTDLQMIFILNELKKGLRKSDDEDDEDDE